MMKNWILATTTTKLPHPFGAKNSPYRQFDDAVDPNALLSQKFGSGQDYSFFEVVLDTKPSINDVTQKVITAMTTGTDGKSYRGAYDDPVWRVSYTVVANDLESAKETKLAYLEGDKITAINQGYTAGSYHFDFSQDFFDMLGQRLDWLERAEANGTVTAGQTITFSDSNGLEVSVNSTQLETQYMNYGAAYMTIFEKAVNKKDAILAATTVTGVDAITWTF